MSQANFFLLEGTLIGDPEIKFVKSGTCMAKMKIKVEESYKDKTGTWVSKDFTIEATAWGKLAENVGEDAKNGGGVILQGKLGVNSGISKAGNPFAIPTITADKVHYTKGKQYNKPANSPAPAPTSIPSSAQDDDDVPF